MNVQFMNDPLPRPNGTAEPFIRKVKRGGDFLREYEPIVYVFDGLLPEACIYGVTGRRSTGKTAFLRSSLPTFAPSLLNHP